MESVALQVIPRKEPSFYLFKHKDIDGLQLPLKGSSRVKYISFNVSTNYIALGTNAGGIHIFRKSSLRHYRFLNAKVFPQPDSSRIVDVGVTNVLFSKQEKLLAAALSSGYVAIWELNFDKREASQLVKKTDEHRGSTVTNLCWNSSSTRLFVGDSKGCVSALEVGKIRRVHTIIKEGPAIVQLDYADEKLLISNTKKCVYYEQSKETLVPIGTKARDGLYGACFLLETNNQATIYCARPGARLWEVDSSGQVLSTQQYKKLLATTSSPVVGHVSGNEKGVVECCETYNFPKLLVLRDQYLMTWTKQSIVVIDPKLGNLILWNNQLENIEDICCNRQEIFVFQTGGCLTRYSLIPPKECAAKLFVLGDWLQCSQILISCKMQIIPVAARDHVPEYVVRRVKEMLNDNLQHEEIVRELSELEESLERLPTDHAIDGIEVLGASSFDDSESRSMASDFVSNPDSENIYNPPLDSGMVDVQDSAKGEKKEKLSKLKNVFKDHMKELSLDSVLLAGAQAAGHMGPFSFGSGGNVKTFSSSWEVKNSRYDTRSPTESEVVGDDTSSGDTALTTSHSGNDSLGPLEDAESDTEERKTPIVFKEKKKKKVKIHTIDIVSPLQPTDLIKMENSKATYRSGEDLEKVTDPSKTVDVQMWDTTNQNTESALGSESGIQAQSPESKESIRSRSVAAKQEVVQKARKFLKRLTPDEKVTGSDEATKTFNAKGSGSKGMSTNITSPLEVKSLVIISRETRKKIREKLLYDPKALKAALCDWIIYLEKANIAVGLVYPKNKDTREYYVTDVGKILSPSIKVDLSKFLDSQDTTIVAELTTLCFKMKIFSSSFENDSHVEEEITSEQLLKCDNCEQKQNNAVLNIDSVKVYEEPQSNEAMKYDLAKTKFLCANFQLLDYQTLRESVVANCLNHQHLLKNLLRCLDVEPVKQDDFTERDAVDDAIDTGDTKVALQLMKDKAENYQNRLLRHVFRLYYLVPRDVAKLCAEIYPYLRPWEVALFCLSTSTNLYSNCSDFLIYVTHLIQGHAKKSEHKLDILNKISRSEDFVILVYHSALILDDLADSDVRCSCGWPRPGSHQTSFQYEELMIDIIKHFKDTNDTEALKKLLNISYNHGYWQGCIQLLVMLGLRTEALKLSFQLGDISLLNSMQIWGWLPQSLSEWKFGLEYLASFQCNTGGEKIQNDSYSASYEMVMNSEKSLDTEETNGSFSNDNLHKNSSEVHDADGKKAGKIGEAMSKTNPKFNEQCGQRMPEELGVNEKGKFAASFSDKASLKEDGNSSEQHTCIKSNASAGHRSLYIDIKSYVLIMLQKLGAQQTLRIISDTKLQRIFFTEEFYYKCILSSLLENHESALSHRILREVNDHMWSSKSTALVPEVYQMKEVEISSNNKEELFNGKGPLKYFRSLEDAACNWGIDLPLAVSSCTLCPLPLCEKLPGHSQGVIIFPCGHLYHKECNLDNYCLICFHKKLQIPWKRACNLPRPSHA